MLDRFNDEFIVTGHVEEGTTSSRVAELNQRLTAEGVLGPRKERARSSEIPGPVQPEIKYRCNSVLKENYSKTVERGSSFGRIPLILES